MCFETCNTCSESSNDPNNQKCTSCKGFTILAGNNCIPPRNNLAYFFEDNDISYINSGEDKMMTYKNLLVTLTSIVNQKKEEDKKILV